MHLVVYDNRVETMLYGRASVTGNQYFRAYQIAQIFLGYQQ